MLLAMMALVATEVVVPLLEHLGEPTRPPRVHRPRGPPEPSPELVIDPLLSA